jgi:sugar phosphate isomerase/epimerase
MKLTISTLVCPDWTLEQVVEACAAAGVAGVELRGLGAEIDVTRLGAFTWGLDHTLERLRAKGLEISCYATSVTLLSPSPQRWQEMLDEAHRYARLAAQTRTPFIRIFGGALPKGADRSAVLPVLRRHLRQIVKMCRAHGATPLLETHDAWSTAAAVRELLHEFDPAEAGVLWDVEHTTRAGEAPGDVAEALRPYIRHVHLKDSLELDGKKVPKLLGEGDLPVADALRCLRAIGYGGWVCLETERRWHPDLAPAPEVSIPHFVAYMRKAG